MISKKKVTALALAGLFVTPVLADTYVPNNNSIQSGDGYLTLKVVQNGHDTQVKMTF